MERDKRRRDPSSRVTIVVPDEVGRSLQTIGRSLAAIAMRFSRSHLKTDKARIHYLQGLGFDRNEIAAILGTSPATVSVRLSERRSGKQTRRKRRGKD
jgi:CRP-like cAMP-binding protein